LRRLTRAELLNQLLQGTMDTGLRGAPAFQRLLAVVRGAQGVELTFGRAPEGASALASLVR